MRLRSINLAVAVLWFAVPGPASIPQPTAPDLILHHGRILTVDALDREVEAIAIRGNRIVALGSHTEVLRLAGATTRQIDLGGRTVTPGLLDAHAHFSGGAVERYFLLDVSYPAARSIADIVAAVRRRTDSLPAGTFVDGAGWDEGKFLERRMITAADLDAVSPRHPVVLQNTTGHYSVVNSVALRLANITRETADPPSGTIDRAADGTPTGVLKESAQRLVQRLVPPATAAQELEAMRALGREFSAEGMTGLKDPGISAETFERYRTLAAAGELPVRVFALFSGGSSVADAQRLIAARAATARPYESVGDTHVIAGGVKLFADGSGGARTAWVYDEWNIGVTGVDRGNRGYPAMDPDTLRAMIRMYHGAGMHVSTHAIGDRTIDWVVESYAEALREKPTRGLRHGIIHANIPTDHAIGLMQMLQRDFDAGYPEPSAAFHWWIGDNYAGNFGAARSRRLNPFATFASRGLIWANGSDFPVTPFPARHGLWAAVARSTMLGRYPGDPFGRDEAVDVRTALKSVTIWPARQMFLEREVGSLEVGKRADLAVWDRDPLRVPTAELQGMRCLLTVFDGKVVFTAKGGPF